MQSPSDTAVAAARDMAPRDPEGALKRTLEIGRETDYKSGRIRAFAVAMYALGILGRYDQALTCYEEGLELASRASKMALAELELEVASIHLFEGNPDEASVHLALGRRHLEAPLARASRNRSEGGRRKLRWLEVLQANAEWLAGVIALRKGDIHKAYRAGLLMAEISDEKTVQRSSVTLIAAAAFAIPGENREKLTEALEMVEQTEAKLTRWDNPVHKLKLRWTRAGILARLGELLQAERILEQVTGLLRAHNYHRDAEKAEQDLRWIRDKLREEAGWGLHPLGGSSSSVIPPR